MSSSSDELLFLDPVFKPTIWGGRKLATGFGYEIPEGPVGECWAISAHEHGCCRVRGGSWDGWSLSGLWAEHRELFGAVAGDRFPLLVKIIDAASDLSIQVHPDDAYAAAHEHGSLGKRECWYVLAAEPSATIIVGQRARGREEFAAKVAEGAWGELLNEIPVHAGDFFQIEPGTVHAIKGGTMVLETQQSSDITYRVYDYDRRDAAGQARELHLAQALDVIDYGMPALASGAVRAPEEDGITKLVETPSYAVFRARATHDCPVQLPACETFRCLSIVAGRAVARSSAGSYDLPLGAHALIPAAGAPLTLSGDVTAIVSLPAATR